MWPPPEQAPQQPVWQAPPEQAPAWQKPAWQQTAIPWPQQASYPQYVWPGWYQPEPGPAPRRRRSGVAAAAAVLLLVSVWAALVMGVPWLLDDLTSISPVGTTRSDAGLTHVPASITATHFKPTRADKAFFAAVGFNSRRDSYVVKWDVPVVHVRVLGRSRPEDRHTLAAILAMLNRTDHGRPRFVLTAGRPDISIRYVAHERFVASQKWGDRVAGVCFFSYRSSGSLSGARIRLDDALTDVGGERPGTLFHEFGHAIGLDDARASRWRDTIMYFETGGATSFTRQDLAAIRMLYDTRVRAGEAREPALATWSGR